MAALRVLEHMFALAAKDSNPPILPIWSKPREREEGVIYETVKAVGTSANTSLAIS